MLVDVVGHWVVGRGLHGAIQKREELVWIGVIVDLVERHPSWEWSHKLLVNANAMSLFRGEVIGKVINNALRAPKRLVPALGVEAQS